MSFPINRSDASSAQTVSDNPLARRKTDPQLALSALAFWRRIYIRWPFFLFCALLVLIVGVGGLYYQHGYQTEFQALQQRLMGVITTLSRAVEGAPVAAYAAQLADQRQRRREASNQPPRLRQPAGTALLENAQTRADALAADRAVPQALQGLLAAEAPPVTPYHAELQKLFKYVAGIDPDISTVYVLLPTEKPGRLQFYLDFATQGETAKIGEFYDATELPALLQGFMGPTVEPRPYRDIYGLSLSAYAPVKDATGQVIGIVGADVEVDRLQALGQRVWRVAFGLTVGAALLALVVAFWLARGLHRPLAALMGGAARVSEGNLQATIDLNRQDEFGVLAVTFNQMVRDLKDREMVRELFGMYMSKKLAHVLLQRGETPNLGGEERFATILFCDLKSYTKISERMSPQQLVETLNTFFGAMNEIIDEHGGCVIEYMGDAILAVFGAPFYEQNHAMGAVGAAMAMQHRLDALNTLWEQSDIAYLWQESGIRQLEMRVGIHTGMLVAGNLGSKSRMKYGVIGDTVNVASRLETLNNDFGTSILISDAVRLHLSPELKKDLQFCGEHELKGRKRFVSVYTVDPLVKGHPVELNEASTHA